MTEAKKTAVTVPETAQDAPEVRDVSQDVREQETVSGAAEAPQEAAQETSSQHVDFYRHSITIPEHSPQEIIGPADETELAGCQEEILLEGLLRTYAVVPEGGLHLREEPDLKAPVLATLPCGAGVLAEDGPAEAGWRQVYTGRLSGWMMARHLELMDYPPELAAHGAY